MIMDKLVEFGDEFSVAQAAGTYLFTNQVDASVVRDVGNGRPVYLVLAVGATAIITGGAAGTLQFAFVSDDSASIHASTRSVHLLTQAFVTDDIALTDFATPGKIIFCGAIPNGATEPYERYLGVQAIVATTTITAGTVNAFLTLDPTGWVATADAI